MQPRAAAAAKRKLDQAVAVARASDPPLSRAEIDGAASMSRQAARLHGVGDQTPAG